MRFPRRKWLMHFHLKSGKTIRVVMHDFKFLKNQQNELAKITWPPDTCLDYIRVEEIEAITSRQCWLRWTFRNTF